MSRKIAEMFEIPQIVSTQYFDSVELFSREGIWQLCYRDLRERDVQIASKTEMSELCFNDETIFPDVLQEMACKVLEDGKKNRLNCGLLTGKGVKVAVIDRPINKNHVEFAGRISYIEVLPEHEDMLYMDFHGMTCASFLCGATCGVARDAELFYFAIPNRTNVINEYYGYQLLALEKVLEYNRQNEHPIRVVSLSAPFAKEQMERRIELVSELEKTGCAVVDATFFGRIVGQGIDCDCNSDNPEYCLNQWQIENYNRNKEREDFVKYFNNLCFVPSTRRTSAGNDSKTSYIHWSKAVSESWTIPHFAGAYAVCLQEKPDLSFAKFVELARHCPTVGERIILDVADIVKRMNESR